MRLAWRSVRRIALLALLAACAVMLCIGIGCDDNPTGPGDPTESYRIFMLDNMNYALYSYWPAKDSIDFYPLLIPFINGMAVSPDGERLYVSWMSRSLDVRDTDSGFTDTTMQYPYDSLLTPVVSPDGQYLALLGDYLLILRTSDFAVVFLDSNDASAGRFSDDSRSLYVGVRNEATDSYDVGIVAVEDSVLTRKSFPGLSVFQVQSVNDGGNWLIYADAGTSDCQFLDYDPALDSIVFTEDIGPGHGYFVVAPDGNRAYYANAGTAENPGLGEPNFRVYNIRQHSLIRTVSTEISWDGASIPSPLFCPGEMVITPDGRYLVMLQGGDRFPGRYLTYDLLAEKFVAFRQVCYTLMSPCVPSVPE